MTTVSNLQAKTAFDITPNNSANLAPAAMLVYIGVGGNLKIDTVGGSTVTFLNLPTGSILPVLAKRVYATGTTATNLIGLR